MALTTDSWAVYNIYQYTNYRGWQGLPRSAFQAVWILAVECNASIREHVESMAL